jgi:hypothetical protein
MFVSESSSGGEETVGVVGGGAVEEGEDVEPDDDQAEFHAADDQLTHPAVQPRWPTRVFAAECVRRIIVACEGNKSAHFDLSLAKEMQLTKSRGGSSFLISLTNERNILFNIFSIRVHKKLNYYIYLFVVYYVVSNDRMVNG